MRAERCCGGYNGFQQTLRLIEIYAEWRQKMLALGWRKPEEAAH